MQSVIQDNFFVIDNQNLEQVQTKFYGYGFLNNQVVEECQLDHSHKYEFDGRGAYVYIRRDNPDIEIRQDFMGSFGLYLYQKDGDFAISNSFLKLVEYLKPRVHLTLNEDYANFLVVADVCFISYSETLVNEISIIPRNTVVTINTESKELSFDYIDYKEYTVDLDSHEAFDILDSWYERWIKTLRYAKAEGSSIMEDLSGGFDSRLPLVLMLNSGIDMNTIKMNSYTDGLHTHAEDLEIATDIANHYGFQLNQNQNLDSNRIWYTRDEQMMASYYIKLGFHKQMYYKGFRNIKRRYMLGGAGGECIRGYWDYDFDGFVQKQYGRCGWLSPDTQKKVKASVLKLLKSAQKQLVEKYHMDDPNSRVLVDHFFTDIYSRNHFGKDAVENYMSYSFRLSPLLDPVLHQIKVRNEGCSDRNLLTSVIFERYAKELLDFRFDSNRSIAPETIEYAKKINNKYPLPAFDFTIGECEYLDKLNCVDYRQIFPERTRVTGEDMNNYVIECFYSPKVRSIMEWGAPCPDVYDFAIKDIAFRSYMPLSNAYTMLVIAKMIQDCADDGKISNQTIIDFMHSLEPGKNTWELSLLEKQKELMEQNAALREEISKLQRNEKLTVKKMKATEKKMKATEKKLEDVKNSNSYKVGRKVTWVPRKIKSVLKSDTNLK